MRKMTKMMILSGGHEREPDVEERRRRYREEDHYPDYDYPENRRKYNVNISNNRYYPKSPRYDGGDYNIYRDPRYHDDQSNPIGFADMQYDGDEYEEKQKHKEFDQYGTIIDSKRHKNKKMNRDTAEEWMEKMKNEDGTKGAHWTLEQCEQAMRQRGIDCDPTEFCVAMNMMYSDYCGVAKMLNTNTVDFYVYMAKAFLDDDDAKEDKLMKYYECIVK